MNDRSCRVLCGALFLVFAATASRAFAAEDPTQLPAPDASDNSAAATPPPTDSGGNAAPRDDDAPRPEHFRIGVLGGIGLPRPLAIEGMIKVERLLGVGVDYSTLPSLNISGVRTSFWALAADVRVFPFRGAFFVGLRAGYQHLGASTTLTVDNVGSAAVSARVDTTFINPRLGFLWTWEPGITLGLDAGVQIPLHSTVTTDMPAIATGTVVDQELTGVASALGQTVLPTVDLLRVGFLL